MLKLSLAAEHPNGSAKAFKVILIVYGHRESFSFMQTRLMHISLYAYMTRAMITIEVKKLGGEPSWRIAPANPFGSSARKI